MIWFVLIMLLGCSAIASGSETALFALSRSKLIQFSADPGVLRRRAYELMRHPRRVLLTVLITNTAVNVAIFSASYIALERTSHAGAGTAAAASVGVLAAVIVFGEMMPKSIAFANADRMAPLAGAVVFVLDVVLGPVRWLAGALLVNPITRLLSPATGEPDAVTTEELRLLVDHSARDGHINSTENRVLQSVIALGDASVREVMTPRVDIRYATTRDTAARARAIFKESGRRRMPLCEGNLDHIRGMLYARRLYVSEDLPLHRLAQPVRYVPEQASLSQLLRFFRETGTRVAIVVDEYGGTAGLVTLEDVVDWIVGGLPEHESPQPESTTQQIDENTYILSGDLSTRSWADRFGVGEIDRHVDTVAGLILSRLGRVPRVGDEVRIRNLTLRVEALAGRRIARVWLSRDDPDRPVEEQRA